MLPVASQNWKSLVGIDFMKCNQITDLDTGEMWEDCEHPISIIGYSDFAHLPDWFGKNIKVGVHAPIFPDFPRQAPQPSCYNGSAYDCVAQLQFHYIPYYRFISTIEVSN